MCDYGHVQVGDGQVHYKDGLDGVQFLAVGHGDEDEDVAERADAGGQRQRHDDGDGQLGVSMQKLVPSHHRIVLEECRHNTFISTTDTMSL